VTVIRKDLTLGEAPVGSRDGGRHARSARSRRTVARVGTVVAAVLVTVIGLAGPAGAHVTVTPSTTAAGAHAVLDFSVSHGCEGSSTTEITIRIADEINAVAPTRNALWDVEKDVVELDPPVTDSHGNQVTERVASVTYRTDAPLPDGYREVFELSVQLPEAEGTTLVFPTIQTCEQGEAAWIQVAEDGESEADLELPAPAFVVTAAEPGGHRAEITATDTASAGHNVAESSTSQDSENSRALTLAALGAGLLGALLGGAAIVLQRRRT